MNNSFIFWVAEGGDPYMHNKPFWNIIYILWLFKINHYAKMIHYSLNAYV